MHNIQVGKEENTILSLHKDRLNHIVHRLKEVETALSAVDAVLFGDPPHLEGARKETISQESPQGLLPIVSHGLAQIEERLGSVEAFAYNIRERL